MSVKNQEKRKRTETERKAKAKAKPKAKPPREIAVLRKVSRAELDAVIKGVAEQFESRDQKIQEVISRLWDNQTELKGGLDVAEFHLRAYRHLIADLCNKLFNEGDVVMRELPEVPSKFRKDMDGKPLPVRVVNMTHYFKLAQKEIAALAEAERRKKEAETVQKAIFHLQEVCTPESLIDIRDRVLAGEKILKDESGKEIELSPETLAFAVKLLGNAVELKTKPPAPEEQTASEEDVPPGAAIFGGEGTP